MKRLISLPIILSLIAINLEGLTQDYKNTIVSPVLDVAINETENIIYASSFHLAWKNLQDKIIKEDVLLEKYIPYVEFLNNTKPAPAGDDCSVNLAGFVKNGIENEIARELMQKFNKEIDLSEYTRDKSNIICYSYFRKEIQFATTFESYGQPFPFFSSGMLYDTECFGIWNKSNSKHHEELQKMVKVYDFKNSADFIISISNPGEEDEIVIAICSPGGTLNETIKTVLDRIKDSGPTELVDNDRLIIPKIHIDAHKAFTELYGVNLMNNNFEEYFFVESRQDVVFTLDESGASADAEAKLILKKGPGPRTMMVNRPFLVMMKEKQSNKPYFATWIANPELLITEHNRILYAQ